MPVYPILAFSTISSQLSTQNYYTEECENLRGHTYENIALAHFTALY